MGRNITAPIAHRTISGLDGKYPIVASSSSWLANNNKNTFARFYTDISIIGTTALADDPQITLRPYFRNGGITGSVCFGDTVSVVRPRLADLSSIKFLKTTDGGTNYTNPSANVIDNNAATQAELGGLDTAANNDWFLIGCPAPFCGVALDIDAVNKNSNAATLTVEYWNGTAWAAFQNLVDGTASAGATLAQDGQVTWNLANASSWAALELATYNFYWVRMSVSAALSASVDIEEVDILMPIKVGIDVQADGDDVYLSLESQDESVTGTLNFVGSVKVAWK
jgi:hypothetical protein